MVVLSIAILTKSGKPLVSRQFVEMTRIRIEGLLSAFPKLLSNDSKQQHTFFETKEVRYVYQPLDNNLYLLLITNCASNIVEDLETLRLLSKLVPSIVASAGGGVTEEKILEQAFELIFAFDEVISNGGYRENINLNQIKSNLEMDSHEEKLQNMIKLSKIESAKDKASQAAERIIKDRQASGGSMPGIGGGSMPGIGGGSMQGIGGGMGYDKDNYSSSYESSSISSSSIPSASGGLYSSTSSSPAPISVPSRAGISKGMSLGGESKPDVFLSSLMKDEKLSPISSNLNTLSSPTASASAAPEVTKSQFPLTLVLQEKISYNNKDESKLDIKGSLSLTAATEEVSFATLSLNIPNSKDFSFNTHPKVNKSLFEQKNVLQLKDLKQGFPTGRPVGILKWEKLNSSSIEAPLTVSSWVDENGDGNSTVTIDYSSRLTNKIFLSNVIIKIPLGTTTASPSFLSPVTIGNLKHNSSTGELWWMIDMIDEDNQQATLEFTIRQSDTSAFSPIQISFKSMELFSGMEILEVINPQNNNSIQYSINKELSTDQYYIV